MPFSAAARHGSNGGNDLIYLGVRYWRAPSNPVRTSAAAGTAAYRTLFVQAFVTSTTNPKGIVFYFAFLPLFVSPGLPAQIQLLILEVLTWSFSYRR